MVGLEPSAAPGARRHALREAVLRRIGTGEAGSVISLARALRVDEGDLRDALHWLRTNGLRASVDGDRIEASPFALLHVDALSQALIDTNWEAQVVGITASTNADLLHAVRASGSIDRPVVRLAELQHAGHGRLGRAWHAVPGASLIASFAIPVAAPLARLQGAGLVCGLAALDALGVPEARLKWPNDVVARGRKLAGILVEAHALRERSVLVVGIGLNVSCVPAADAGRSALEAIDLAALGAAAPDRHRIAASLAVALEHRLTRLATEGFGASSTAWNAVDAYRDQCVAIGSIGSEPVIGIERGVDRDGALVVQVDGVRKRFIAGDLSLRPA